jgi:O-antigen/teichoic acid export membrane protein
VSIKTLSLDVSFYGLLGFLQRSVGVIMVPVYTRALSQKEYGELDIILICSSVLCILVDLQFVAGFSRLYYEHRAAGKGGRFAGTAIVSRLIGSIAIASAFLALGFLGHIEFNFLPSFKGHTTVWILAVITIPLSLTYEILLLQTQMLRWKKWFALGALSNCFLTCVFSAFFVTVLKWGIVSIVMGVLLGVLVGLLVLGWGLRKEVVLCVDARPFKELIRYTWPLIPGWWLAFGSAYLSRFVIFSQLGSDQNAILAVCMKIAGVIGMLAACFQMAWQPLAMAHIGHASGEVFYVRSMRLFIAGGILVIFGLTMFLGPILTVLTPTSYGVIKYYFPLFAVGTLLSGCADNLQLGHQIAKTTYWISISAIISFVINLVILIVCTKSYGIFAAGFAWIVSFSVKDIILYFTAQKSYYIAYDKKSFVLLGLGCGLLLLLGFGNYSQHITGWIFTGCIASIGVVLSWFVMAPFERKAILEFVGNRVLGRICG